MEKAQAYDSEVAFDPSSQHMPMMETPVAVPVQYGDEPMEVTCILHVSYVRLGPWTQQWADLPG